LSVLGFSTDELCPPDLLKRFARSAPQLERLDIIDSPYGHDAFLCEPAAVSRVIEQFLAGVTA
jgi:homoserine O-acetyltransferase